MSRRERLRAAVERRPVDRVPYAVWRHFPAVDRSPAGLAQATLRFHDRYGSDFLKLTGPSAWAVVGWGCVEAEEVRPDGHRPCARCAVERPEDWGRIRPLDPSSADGYAHQLETLIRMGFDRRVGDAPVLPTVFSPLSIARRLSGGRLAADLREHPGRVREALAAIAETVGRFIQVALDEGAGGVFYAIQVASPAVLTEDQYAEFGEPDDRRVLEAARRRAFLTVVHLHGERPFFGRVARLPADAWSWEDRMTRPGLDEGWARVPGAVVGGLDPRTLRYGSPQQAEDEARDAIARTGATGLILAPGCVVLPETPDETLAAVVRVAGGQLRPILGLPR